MPLFLMVAACVLLGMGLFFRNSGSPTPPPAAPERVASRVPPPALVNPAPLEVVDHPVIAVAEDLLAADGTAAGDLEILALIFTDYRKALAENPVGENEEISAALLGQNPKGLRFLPPGHRALDAEGRLCDRFGTPWFFHAISAQRMEIHSAGPDRELGTSDDLALP